MGIWSFLWFIYFYWETLLSIWHVKRGIVSHLLHSVFFYSLPFYSSFVLHHYLLFNYLANYIYTHIYVFVKYMYISPQKSSRLSNLKNVYYIYSKIFLDWDAQTLWSQDHFVLLMFVILLLIEDKFSCLPLHLFCCNIKWDTAAGKLQCMHMKEWNF